MTEDFGNNGEQLFEINDGITCQILSKLMDLHRMEEWIINSQPTFIFKRHIFS